MNANLDDVPPMPPAGRLCRGHRGGGAHGEPVVVHQPRAAPRDRHVRRGHRRVAQRLIQSQRSITWETPARPRGATRRRLPGRHAAPHHRTGRPRQGAPAVSGVHALLPALAEERLRDRRGRERHTDRAADAALGPDLAAYLDHPPTGRITADQLRRHVHPRGSRDRLSLPRSPTRPSGSSPRSSGPSSASGMPPSWCCPASSPAATSSWRTTPDSARRWPPARSRRPSASGSPAPSSPRTCCRRTSPVLPLRPTTTSSPSGRPALHRPAARRRDQPHAPEDAVSAARGDAGGTDRRGRDLPAAPPVPRAGDRQPRRVRGHLPAARGQTRPVPPAGQLRLPHPAGGVGGPAAPHGPAPGGADGQGGDRRRGAHAMQQAIEEVTVDEAVGRYCVKLVDATRRHQHLLMGSSPRGSLALLLTARAYAVVQGPRLRHPRRRQGGGARARPPRHRAARALDERGHLGDRHRVVLSATPCPCCRSGPGIGLRPAVSSSLASAAAPTELAPVRPPGPTPPTPVPLSPGSGWWRSGCCSAARSCSCSARRCCSSRCGAC